MSTKKASIIFSTNEHKCEWKVEVNLIQCFLLVSIRPWAVTLWQKLRDEKVLVDDDECKQSRFYWFIDTALKSFDIASIPVVIVHDKWTYVTPISLQQLTSQLHLHNVFKFTIHYNFMCAKCERQNYIGRRVVLNFKHRCRLKLISLLCF